MLITGVSVKSRTDVKYGRTWKRETGGEKYITLIKENSFGKLRWTTELWHHTLHHVSNLAACLNIIFVNRICQ